MVRSRHALLIAVAVVAIVTSPARTFAQDDYESREFISIVHPGALKASGGLSTGERMLAFDRPVQVPGAKLFPGAYIFRMATPSLVQVMDPTRAKIYTTFFVIPLYRRDDDDGQERIKFQQAGDESPRIVAWLIPGQTGYEFAYQKQKRQSPDRRVER
jgi:hypothetical protein